jgi:regulatory protein
MNLLARRDHAPAELASKLRLKNFAPPDIEAVLNNLVEEGLLNQNRFIENYIQYRQNRGFGPVRIRGELLERGLSEEFIDHHLNIADNAWFSQIRQVWKKRFKGKSPSDFKNRAQQMRFLQYRGFTIDQIESIFHSED